MSTFVALSPADCTYLLDLIEDMDSDTIYTAHQRGYTVPKLESIRDGARGARLAYQDVTYLLELIEDDQDPQFEQQRAMVQSALEEIQDLQTKHRQTRETIDQQREARRSRRQPTEALQQHFAHTDAI